MSILSLLLLGFVIYLVYKISVQASTKVLSNWHQLFHRVQFSSQEFYEVLEQVIKEKELQRLRISRTAYSEGGILSPRREYVRVQYKNYFFDICAAPFAKDFFVSWWLSEEGSPITDALKGIPIIRAFVSKREKTFYELDSENIFKELVRGCVSAAIEQMTETKGYRNVHDMGMKSLDTSSMMQQ